MQNDSRRGSYDQLRATRKPLIEKKINTPSEPPSSVVLLHAGSPVSVKAKLCVNRTQPAANSRSRSKLFAPRRWRSASSSRIARSRRGKEDIHHHRHLGGGQVVRHRQA